LNRRCVPRGRSIGRARLRCTHVTCGDTGVMATGILETFDPREGDFGGHVVAAVVSAELTGDPAWRWFEASP